MQSFLKTADALKIKGLADQGLVPDQNNFNSTSGSSGTITSGSPPLVDKSDESAVEDESMSSFEPPPYNNPSPQIGMFEPAIHLTR